MLAWQERFETDLAVLSELIGQPPIVVRTCVHVGDVLLDGVNPVALAVSQLFKIEKNIPGGEIVLTDSAYHAARPTLGLAYHAFEEFDEVPMDGYPGKVRLHRLLRELHAGVAEFAAEGHFDD